MVEGEKIVVIKVFRENVPRLCVTYKDKYELFNAYKKWIKELKLPSNEVYWCDSWGDHTGIRNADDLLGAVQDHGYAKFFSPIDEDDDLIFHTDSEKEQCDQCARGRNRDKKRTANSRPHHSTRSLSAARSLAQQN